MELAGHIWTVTHDVHAQESAVPAFESAQVDTAIAIAKASQRRDTPGIASTTHVDMAPILSTHMSCSVAEIRAWLRDIRTDDKQRRVLDGAQFAVVKRVADRMCDEMNALATDDFEAPGEPLRWSMHGGPGTGTTRVINVIKE